MPNRVTDDAPHKVRKPTLLPALTRWTTRLCAAGAACAYLAGMAVFSVFAYLSGNLPDPSRLWEETRPPSIQVIDRQGRDVTVRGPELFDPVPMDTLPAHVTQAFLATEDRRFYSHAGIDPLGILRATYRNYQAGRVVEGGSTLTQQLTKNVFLTREQTLTRKAQEVMLAVWLERRFSKDELFRLYLSRVFFGGEAYSLEAATDQYFGRSPTDITLPEAAMLAGLLKAPSSLYPIHNPDGAAARMRIILRSMDRQGLLDDGVLETALSIPVSVNKPNSNDPSDYFMNWIWSDIVERIGIPNQDLTVQVSLDLDIQRAAHQALQAHLEPERNATQGAVVVLDDRGGVLAMVGGRSFGDSQFNRAVQAKRQPGSSFKPVVYLAALRAGLSPWTERMDAPIIVDGWSPENFKGEYNGLMTLDEALARSANTVSVQITEEIGRGRVVDTATSLGLDGMQPFPSLALGAQGVSVLDMAETYQIFASGGHRATPNGLVSIATATGTPLYDAERISLEPVMSFEEVRLMNHMLVRAVERGTGRRARVENRMIAGKTGTTNDNRDAWFVGYAPGVSVAVWVGDDENRPMRGVTGGTIPAEIFADVMTEVLRERPVTRLPVAQEPDWSRQREQFTSLLDQLAAVTAERPETVPPSDEGDIN